MDDNKDKMEDVQADEITSADTEKKDNKKKIIIISSIVASVVIIGSISWFIVTAIDKGQEFVDGVSDSVNNIAENIPSLELEITLENETTTELETTTQQLTTEETTTTKEEIETIDPSTDPFTAVVAGSYTDEDYEYYVKIRTYENGAKRYVYHVDYENKDYEFSKIEEMPEAVALDLVEKLESDGSIIIAGVTSTNEPTTTQKVVTEEEKLEKLLQYDKEDLTYIDNHSSSSCDENDTIVLNAKNKWIKENFGTSFTHNSIEFAWDEANQAYYWIDYYDEIHYMTSTTTSMTGYYYRNKYAFRIADYLGFYGTDYELYHNEKAFNHDIMMISEINQGDKMTVDNPYDNNLAYLKQLGWVEDVEVDGEYHHWDLISAEGIPVKVYQDGYLQIYIKYPTDTDYEKYEFTIEEYNEFVATHIWRVSSDTRYSGFGSASSVEDAIAQGWTKNITKYLIVEE